MSASRPDRPQGQSTPGRRGRPVRPGAETLEGRLLLTGYAPVVGDYNGDRVDEVASFRYDTLNPTDPTSQQIVGRNAILMQASGSSAASGFEVGYNVDQPVAGDFDGDGKTDVAVYGFVNNSIFGETYGTPTSALGPNGLADSTFPTNAFPNGSGRFAYIPSSGVDPLHNTGAVNGTAELAIARMVIVNIGQQGDLPAVADYDGDGKSDFTVYEPSKAQFLTYGSRTFNLNADPTLPGNGPQAVAIGKVGDLPASADYAGVGHAQFAAYDAASGTFFVQAASGGSITTVQLGGPGDIPTPGDFEGLGHADFAVYDPSRGVFLVRPSDGSAVRTVAVGAPGDTPTVGRFGDGRVDFATYTPATQQTHIVQFTPSGPSFATQTLPNPDLIPVRRTDALTIAAHAALKADTSNPSVLFLGDSVNYRWNLENPATWKTRITQFNPDNHSLAADTTQNLLDRIDDGELDHLRPWVVLLNIGNNDFIDRTPAQVAASTEAIIQAVHAHIPNTQVLLMDLLPRGTADPTVAGAYLGADQFVASEIRDLDRNYLPQIAPPFSQRSLAQYPHGDYSIDLQPYFSANPSDPTNYFANLSLYNSDTEHPSPLGTDVWANAITTPLRLMLHRQAVPSDYDGDGHSDLTIYAPALGSFFTNYSSTGITGPVPYGIAGVGQSIPAPGDYDGDGRTDYATYIPTLGEFALTTSGTNTTVTIPFGAAGVGQSIPAVGDYDGDGKSDLAVYEPATGSFLIHNSTTNTTNSVQFGIPGSGQSIPVPGDYDGDGRTDLAVYLPAVGVFAYRPSSGGPDVLEQFGIPGLGNSIPVAGDFDGDARSDPAVYLPSLGAFVVRQSTTGHDVATYLGRAGVGNAIPSPGDYDGDGRADLAVFDPTYGRMTILFSGLNTVASFPYGPAGPGATLPVTARFIATPSPLIGSASPAGSLVSPASLAATRPGSAATTSTSTAIALPLPTASGTSAESTTRPLPLAALMASAAVAPRGLAGALNPTATTPTTRSIAVPAAQNARRSSAPVVTALPAATRANSAGSAPGPAAVVALPGPLAATTVGRPLPTLSGIHQASIALAAAQTVALPPPRATDSRRAVGSTLGLPPAAQPSPRGVVIALPGSTASNAQRSTSRPLGTTTQSTN